MSKKAENEDPEFFSYTDDSLTCSLSQAVRLNDKSTLQRILNKRKKNPLPLSADNRGWTALHIAASRPERKECLEMLLRYGDSVLIDLESESFDGKTAIFVACENGCEENVLILLQKGCDLKKKKVIGASPLHIAATNGYHRIVDHLLDYRININDQDWQYFTPLHLAAMNGHLEVCRVLLENGASVRLTDSDGNLPLHLACRNGHFDIVKLLLEHDLTTINFPNHHDITPPMLAVQNHNVHCVRYLLDNGARTEVCNRDCVIALQFAAAGGSKEVLEMVLQSTDMASIELYCLFNFLKILDRKGIFHSLTCCALNSGSVECLSALLESQLPKSILEAPYAENSGYSVDVLSPLAYLFSINSETIDETFDSFLNLLLEHDIVFMKDFSKALQVKWRISADFVNPFTIICSSDWAGRKFHYFNYLSSKGVTPDYCLQCYNNNEEKFEDFCVPLGYLSFYKPVLEAVSRGDVETVKLFMENSQILEPELLCCYLVRKTCELPKNLFHKHAETVRPMYEYLIKLKPYHTYNYKLTVGHMKQFSKCGKLFLDNNEFVLSNLQQLCRTVIRSQIRELTIADNLLHFRRKINKLPLPAALKDYLLFKS